MLCFSPKNVMKKCPSHIIIKNVRSEFFVRFFWPKKSLILANVAKPRKKYFPHQRKSNEQQKKSLTEQENWRNYSLGYFFSAIPPPIPLMHFYSIDHFADKCCEMLLPLFRGKNPVSSYTGEREKMQLVWLVFMVLSRTSLIFSSFLRRCYIVCLLSFWDGGGVINW